MIHYKKRTWVILLGMFVAIFTFTFLTGRIKDNQEAAAANPWAFDAGYIISDWQMSNYTSMSEADIQNFLNSKNGCGDTDYSHYQWLESYYPNLDWHWDGSRIVCLAQERFNGNSIGSGQTAAHIIWQVAQDYRINPQVLIVLLEKEQGLITDTYPNNKQYQTATGFGCPDTAPCDSQYFGLENQLRKAAGLFREVLDGGWTNYPVGNNYVLYNPNPACGGTIVNIRNRATSALYRYTPYQPNHSALAAGYGVGDACGAYGNRNFYLMFEDWFGGVTREGYVMPDSSDLNEGNYTIRSTVQKNKVIDVSGDIRNAKNKTNIQIYDENGSSDQVWSLKNNGDDTYTIINPATNKALDVDGAGKIDGTNVNLYEQNGTCAQKWKISEREDGKYAIYSFCSGMALDLKSASVANGTNIQIYTPNETNAQRWDLDFHVNGLVTNENFDGEYEISSAVDNKKAVDIKGGADLAKDGTNIQLYDSNNTDAQRWKIKNNNDGTYTFINPKTDMVLDVYGAKKTNSSNVLVFHQNNTCAQKWKIGKNNDGTYSFYSTCSNLPLDLYGAITKNETNIQIYALNGTNAQKWNLRKLGGDISENKTYEIESAVGNNQVIDIRNGADIAINGTNIQTFQRNGTDAQKWKIKRNSDGTYTFVNPYTNKVIDVYGAGIVNYTNVNLYEQNGTCAQKWKIKQNSDHSYTFISACSNMALDVYGAFNANGSNIDIYAENGTSAQKWFLKEI